MNRLFVGIGAGSAAVAVALGAFGAHGLKDKVPASSLEIWQTAAHYHLVHAIALVAIGFGCAVLKSNLLRTAGWFILAGQLIFGVSLYVLVLTDVKILGAITPLGGLAMIVGWVLVAVAAFKSPTAT